jgi:flagellar basal body-associated protein FliL
MGRGGGYGRGGRGGSSGGGGGTVILVLVVLLIIGAVAYFVFFNKDDADTGTPLPSPTVSSEVTPGATLSESP